MKNISTPSLLRSILMIAFSSSNAQAQSAFAGFYGQVSTGYESNLLGRVSGASLETPNMNRDIIGNGASQTFGGAPLVFGVGYYWQAKYKWLIGVGADYSALSQTSSNIPVNITNAPGNTAAIAAGAVHTANGLSMKLSNQFNLFLTPAHAIDKDKLVYLKAGYSQVSAQINRANSHTKTLNGVSTTTAASGGTQSSNPGGYLIGLGYKQMITSGLYGFVEGNYMGYSSPSYSYASVTKSIDTLTGVTNSGSRINTTNFNSLNTYRFLIGLGYAF